MYLLGRYFSFSKTISFTVAAMYMCSGFFIGAIQHINSIAAAAFLPLLLLFTFRLFDKPNYARSFLLSLSIYMVIASGHPGMPMAAAYYVLVLLGSAIFINRRGVKKHLSFLLCLGIAVSLCLLYFLPAIYGYLSILPEYERYISEVPYDVQASAEAKDMISFLFPFSTISHSFFRYDVSFRNLYISLAGILAIPFLAIKSHKWIFPLLISGIFLFVLSLGEPVKNHFYNYLPVINNARTNGHFSVFTILSFCCLSGFGMQALSTNQSFQKFTCSILICLLICITAILFIIIFNSHQLSGFYTALRQSFSITQRIKLFYETISFPVAFLFSLFIAAGILLFLLMRRRQLSMRWITISIIADLIINSILYLPVTGVGTTTVAQVQQVYNSTPAGIPIPPSIPINQIDTLSPEMTGLTGSLSYYNKQIGTRALTDYPSYFTGTDRYFKSADTSFINSQPYLFFKNNTGEKAGNNIHVTQFAPDHINIQTHNRQTDTLVYLQNHYKYWKATVNGQPVPVTTLYHTFMAVPVSAGNATVQLYYSDPVFAWLALIALLAFLIAAACYFRYRNRNV